MNTFQKAGGAAALAHAFAYLVGIIMAVTLIFPNLDAGTGQYIEFVAENQFLMHIWILIIYWVTAITVVIMALALYNRLGARSPALMQTATVFGLIWAALIIASGNLMLNDFHVITSLYLKDPSTASTTWTVLEAVENGITSGNELVGSIWVILLSIAALRSGGLPRSLGFAGIALSVIGIYTLVPDITTQPGVAFVFGIGMVIWSIWLGIILLRGTLTIEA
jgi:hypothetical protein